MGGLDTLDISPGKIPRFLASCRRRAFNRKFGVRGTTGRFSALLALLGAATLAWRADILVGVVHTEGHAKQEACDI